MKYGQGGWNDWGTRQGCSKPPICLRNLSPFTVTYKWERSILFVARIMIMLFLRMTHWNFIGESKKKRKAIELKIQHLLLPDSKAGKIGVKFQFLDSRSGGGNSTTEDRRQEFSLPTRSSTRACWCWSQTTPRLRLPQ